jgi:hypothetical protein
MYDLGASQSKLSCRKSERHTLCSFCKIFSNTRGHSDLSSWVRKRVNGGGHDLRDSHVDGAVACGLL